MAGRGAANGEFMAALAHAMENVSASLQQMSQQSQEQHLQNQQFQQQQQNQFQQQQGPIGYKGLDIFCRRNPPKFEGGFAPDAANDWVQALEKIFRALECSEEQKVTYATYMLSKEAEDWWTFTKQQMDYEQQAITWIAFKGRFLQKYFPADLRVEKEMEFLRLQQGNMSIGDYATQFEALAKYAPHYNQVGNERSKCAKFEDGLTHDLKLAFSHQQIPDFATLVSKCRIYEERLKIRNAELKSAIQQKGSYGPIRNHTSRNPDQNQRHRKETPYNNNRNPQVGNSNNTPPPVCPKCNGRHFSNICPVCFYCKQSGHIRKYCPQRNGETENVVPVTKPPAIGQIFTMSGEEVELEKDLI